MTAHREAFLVAFIVLAACAGTIPAAAAEDDPFTKAGSLYSASVDLANEGRYEEALAAADKALALNAPALTALIQTNRAGILNMLGRFDEALAAADAALAVEGNLTTAHAYAHYNRGEALFNLGRIDEAREAFGKAHAMDSSLAVPFIPVTTTGAGTAAVPKTTAMATAPPPTRAPLTGIPAVAGCAAGAFLMYFTRRTGRG